MYMVYWIVIGAICGVLPLALGYRIGLAFTVGLMLAVGGSIIAGLLINSLVANETGSVHAIDLVASVCVALVLSFGSNLMIRGAS